MTMKSVFDCAELYLIRAFLRSNLSVEQFRDRLSAEKQGLGAMSKLVKFSNSYRRGHSLSIYLKRMQPEERSNGNKKTNT